MKIGVLGNIAFEVTDKHANSFDELKREHAWKYAEHEIAQNKPRLQPVGAQLKTISLRGKFIDNFCKPLKEIDRLIAAADKQQKMTFVMGEKVLGDFVIEKIGDTWKATTANGRVRWIEFEISLKEYN